MSVTGGAAEDTVITLDSRYTSPLAVTAPNSAVEIGIAMPHRDPNATSRSRAPIARPISSAWLANQLTGVFQVSATTPPMSMVRSSARTDSIAVSSWEYGFV